MRRYRQAIINEEDELVLCTIIDDDEELVQEKKKVSFANNVKLKTLHADLLPFMQEVSMMCTIHGQFFYILRKNA